MARLSRQTTPKAKWSRRHYLEGGFIMRCFKQMADPVTGEFFDVPVEFFSGGEVPKLGRYQIQEHVSRVTEAQLFLLSSRGPEPHDNSRKKSD